MTFSLIEGCDQVSDAKSSFWLKQIEAKINGLFSDLIDMSDCAGKQANYRKDALNSRSIAAYSLNVLAEINCDLAAKAVVDGPDDNGIDALFFDKKQKTLWVVQAKWIQKAQGSPAANDMRSFKDGILHLLEFQKNSNRFNYKFEKKEQEIIEAFSYGGGNLKIKVVIAYTGSELAKHSREVLSDLINELNEIAPEMASLEDFNLSRAYSALVESDKEEKIDVSFSLSNWGTIEGPHKAFYGQITASEVAQWWSEYKGKLFAKNIRDFIGGTDVNSDISTTLKENPSLFWYFNNGVTVLCDKVTRRDLKTKRVEGEFIAEGISIVNGAQTIGTIGLLYQDLSPEEKENLESAEIFIRFIASEDSGDFGLQVTRATNTQNRVEVRDFVALDSQQERLYRDFRSGGKAYHYKRTSETFPQDCHNFHLEETTVALACAQDDLNTVITAKQDLSKLWSDTSQPPYTQIFKPEIPGIQVWRQVETKREVDILIKEKLKVSSCEIELAILKYANLLLLHLVLKRSNRAIFSAETSESDFEFFKKSEIPSLLNQIIESCKRYFILNGKSQRLWASFTSPKKTTEIRSHVMQCK